MVAFYRLATERLCNLTGWLCWQGRGGHSLSHSLHNSLNHSLTHVAAAGEQRCVVVVPCLRCVQAAAAAAAAATAAAAAA